MSYTGSVELISGIKQKNGGTFPLVDASAVRVTDDKNLDTELGNFVRTDGTQSLTDEKKVTARENIDAASTQDVDELKSATNAVTEVQVDVAEGRIKTADGTVIPPSADAEVVTGFIYAPAGSIVKFTYVLSTSHYRDIIVAGYDESKIFLSPILLRHEGGSYKTETVEIVIPNGVMFVRVSFKTFGDYESHSLYVALNNQRAIDDIQQEFHDSIANKLDGSCGKNLFDKSGEHTRIVKNHYRMYTTGIWAGNNEYDTALFDATAGDTYSVSVYNCHVCFFSDKDCTSYISGFLVNVQNGKTFTVPVGAVAMSISYGNATADTFMLELGDSPTAYESFVFGLRQSDIVYGGLCTVGNDKEYQTIQEAVNHAKDGDIILIDPGIYVESVDVVSSGKNLHFIGSGRDATIVQYAGDNYYYPPLEIAKGIVEHMSFITTATQKAEGAIDTAYCVHIDYDAETNNSLQFVDCYFESPIRPTVGIGLRENFTLNFTNCKFKSSVYPVYCHEQQANNKTGQRIELIDCLIESTGATSAIHLQESREYSGNEITVLFQRCIAKANGVSGTGIISAVTYPNNQTPSGTGYLGLNGFSLDDASELNNEGILNAGFMDSVAKGSALTSIHAGERPDNLISADIIISGYYINNIGAQARSATWNCTHFIDVEGISHLYGQNIGLGAFYDTGKAFLESFTLGNNDVSVPSAARYIRVSILNENVSSAIICPHNFFRSFSRDLPTSKWVSPKKGYASGFISFTVPVNNTDAVYTSTDEANNEGTPNYVDVDCVLSLPYRYKPVGEPCKLLMMCHGAGKGVSGESNWTTVEGYQALVDTFVSRGYAVFDCNGFKNDALGWSFWGNQKGLEAWRKAYMYVTDNYNVEKTFSIYAFSMGGLTAMNLAFQGFPNINAIAMGSPVLDLKKVWDSTDGTKNVLKTLYGLGDEWDESKVVGNNPYKHIMTIDNINYCPFNLPPIKIWYGSTETNNTSNPAIEKEIARAFVDAIVNSGGYAFYREVSGRGHEICYGGSAIVNTEILTYLERYERSVPTYY